jgi:membrane-bound metal-dependent hydrolase YbcI (DUF457 family)
MVFAFGHLIGAWLIGKLFQLITKRKLSQNSWFFLLIGSIIPDIDFLFQFLFHNHFHRTLTHSIFFILLLPAIVYYGFKLANDKKAINYSYFLAIGICVHLVLDSFSPQGVTLLWPYIHLFSFQPYFETSNGIINAIIDMFIGTSWIFYLFLNKKLKF